MFAYGALMGVVRAPDTSLVGGKDVLPKHLRFLLAQILDLEHRFSGAVDTWRSHR